MIGETLRIGICDDEKEELERIEEAVRESIKRIGILADIRSVLFQDGEEMYEASRTEEFDLFFLDIEMPKSNGFQLAKRIGMGRKETYLIFVSAHESFVFDSQQYMPLWFVRKGMLERDMFLALKKYFQLTAPKRIGYKIKGWNGHREVYIHDVAYIECRGHLLMIQRTDGKILKQYGSLRALEEELSNYNFLRIHKSYLVNQEYIEEIGKREVYLTDGTILEMGRDRRKALHEAMLKYEREHYGYR